ncbi:MAG: hypothetical protein IT480_14035 [Gammaproteobacteria bacterium]|nr:hypothetical protein [Gammaproteobacteria bacterium]
MNRCTARLLMLAISMGAVPLSAVAQSCQPLEGSWTLMPEQGDLGSGLAFNPYYAITGVQLTMRLQGQRIEQRWQFSGPHVARSTHYSFTADGTRQATAVAEPMDFEYVAVAASWQNCTLVQSGFSHLFGMEVRTINTYVVSPDGTRLEILQYGESPISVIDRRLVFRRGS